LEAIEIVIATWGLYLVPFLLVGGPVWFFGRRRVQWNRWDFALVLLPFAVWIALMMANHAGKSFANLGEAFCLGCVAPLAPIIRVAVGDRANHELLALALLVGVCLVATGLWAFVPGTPQ
jgi:hypothetical protein